MSWQTGDVVIVIGLNEGLSTLGTPTATGLTFNPDQTVAGSISVCGSMCASAVAGGTSSATVNMTNSIVTKHFGFGVWVWRSSTGVGNSVEQHTATNTKALTPTAANGGICWASGDFTAGALGTILPTPTNTRQRVQGANYSFYVSDLADQTSSGSVSYGTNAGTGGPFSIVAIEVKNDGGGGATGQPYRLRTGNIPGMGNQQGGW